MPARQRGHVRRLPSGKVQLRYYDNEGERQTGGVFDTKTAALDYFRNEIEPRLNGTAPKRDLTLAELVELYLERHAAVVRGRTIRTLRQRLGYATRDYGDVSLAELERMSGELASWRGKLPERSRYGVFSALRQTLEAGVRWGYIGANPAKLAGRNPQPPPRPIRPYSFTELEAITAELSRASGGRTE
jgi:hypothetical protein